MNTQTPWYDSLRNIRSLGSTVTRPGSLAGLHATRQIHGGQFFTPDDVVGVMWRIVSPAMEKALAEEPRGWLALFDNSLGCGRMFQFADPLKHSLAGCDPHEPSVGAFADAAEAAGFNVDVHAVGMERARPRGFNVGLINPPFSLHLDSPLLEPSMCTTRGAYGPHSSAVSHAYALEQALLACEIVVAVLPTPYANELRTGDLADRLRAVLRLPADSFRTEGTDVDVSLVVFGRESGQGAPVIMKLATLTDALPGFDLECSCAHQSRPDLRVVGMADDGPAITRPVTGDARVRLVHDGRKLLLGFRCGLVEAKCRNALMRHRLAPKRPDDGRYPVGIRFAGQGVLDLELYLAQPDPIRALQTTVDAIRAAGGDPEVEPGLVGYLARRHRMQRRQATPFRRTALVAAGESGAGALVAVARRSVQCNPAKWGSAIFRKGEEVAFTFEGGSYKAKHPVSGEVLRLEGKAFQAAFDVSGEATPVEQWTPIHAGREAAFPKLGGDWRLAFARQGIERVTGWDFQVDDLVDLRLARHGVVGWTMGLGKTRGALCLCLSGGDHNLIMVEAGLVGELVEQIGEVGLDDAVWQAITRPEDCENLRKINIISYSRARMPVAPGAGRRTFARLLRRRIHTLVSDEAHLLRAPDTEQSRAVHMISPKCRYLMTGTPVANYVRDLLNLVRYVGGDGTAVQPFGLHHPHLTPELLKDMTMAARGTDVFRDRHVVTEWVTHTFEDNLTRGAKREVPKVRNLGQLRTWASPFVLRRVAAEPEVAKYVRTPPHSVIHHEVPWDDAHLAYWLTVADDFGAWYRDMRAKQGARGIQVNLVALLARIGAVQMAGNYPQHGVPGFPYRGGLTSKQRALVDRAAQLTREGHKSVVFVKNPGMANLLAAQLQHRGIEAISFTGETSVADRRALLKRFRSTDVPVLTATYGVGGVGLNIPEADRALFGARSWTTKEENQARGRLLRPQQTRNVVFETFELLGSLDTYQAMMLQFKNDATNAAVDFLEPQLEEAEFQHMDRIIDDFVGALAARRGMTTHDFRRSVRHG
ncbi:MAG: hypothetical protein ABS98_01905 [Lysobacteraceae bacterium SCN 69-48]|nr:MAG: hypothetical protein ABS98_01905 [Xanthomonadaceae bacterium SCN 69-48]